MDRSDTADDESREGHGGPASGAAIVEDFRKIRPTLSRYSERTDIHVFPLMKRVALGFTVNHT
jgi:hypothetical protein